MVRMKETQRMAAVAVAVAAACAGWAGTNALGVVLPLEPYGDAQIIGTNGTSSTQDTNYGSLSTLQVRYHSIANNTTPSKTYLQFNLNGIDVSQITAATLTLYCSTGSWRGTTTGTTLNFYGGNPLLNQTWAENTITWNNAPGNITTNGGTFSADSQYLGSYVANSSSSTTLQFSGTALINLLKTDADHLVTIMIGASNNSTNQQNFYSREAASFHPTLTITYNAANAIEWLNTSGGEWTNGSNWVNGTAPTGAGSIATFGTNMASSGTILVSSVTTGSITFNNSTASYTIGSGSLTLNNNGGANPSITVSNGNHTIAADVLLTANTDIITESATTLNISGIVSGNTATINKNNSGTLVLSGNNTYGGGTNLAAGVLSISSVANLGTGTLSFSGGMLQVTGTSFNSLSNVNWSSSSFSGGFDISDAGNTFTIAQDINGASAGSLTKSGAGTLVLSGSNNYTGGTTLNAGSLALTLGAVNALGAGSGKVTVNGGTLDLGGNTLTRTGAIVFAGGTVQNGTLIYNGTNYDARSGIIAAILQGSGGLSKTTTGVLVLTGTNSYSGATTLGGGTLSISSSSNIGTGSLIFNSGILQITGTELHGLSNLTMTSSTFTGSLDVNDVGNTFTVAQDINGNSTGSFSKLGAGTLVMSGNNNYAGGTTVTGGTLQLGSGAISALGASSGKVTVNGGTLNLGGNNLTLTGTVSVSSGTIQNGTITNNSYAFDGQGGAVTANLAGSAGLNKTTSGTLTLGGNNTYTGSTNITSGTLAIAAGATSALSGTSNVTVNGGSLDLGGNNITLAGNVVLQAGTLSNGTLTSANALDARAGTISANLAGSMALNKTTSGSLTLSGTNTYTGGTTVTSGNLYIAANAALALPANGNLLVNGGTVNLGSNNMMLGGTVSILSGTISTGTITNNSYAFDAQGGTISANLNGTAGLNKTGPGLLTLSGTNNYSGGTTLSGGTLNIANVSALGTGSLTIATNDVVVGAGAFVGPTNNLVVNANFAISGTGRLRFAGTTDLGGATRTITFNTTAAVGSDSGLSGLTNGALIKNGTGNFWFGNSASATFTSLTINEGLVYFPTTSGPFVAASTDLVINSAGIMELNTNSQVRGVNPRSLSGNGVIRAGFSGAGVAGTSIVTINGSSNAYDSNFNGSFIENTATSSVIAIDKEGASTLTLSGTSNYSGGTTVGGGRLVVNNALALGSSSGKLVINSTGTVDLNGYSLTFGTLSGNGGFITNGSASATLTTNSTTSTMSASLIDGASGKLALVKDGPGALTLSSSSHTFSGGVTVKAGTLSLGTMGSGGAVVVEAGAGLTLSSMTPAHNFVEMSSLALNGNATLDMTNHDVLVDSGMTEASLISAIPHPGAPVGKNRVYTTGILNSTDWGNLHGGQFHGKDVSGNALALMYTYAGDANLDGLITMDDYLQIDTGYLFDGSGWARGDFNHDGVINASDYALIDQNFLYQNGSAAEEMISLHASWFGAEYTAALAELQAVPEPASLGVLALGMIGLLKRRR